MNYLVDTNVISELRKGKRCDPNVTRWFAGLNDEEIFLSVLTIGEIRMGIERIRRRDASRAAELNGWLIGLTDAFQEKILSIDQDVADEWGRMNVPNQISVIDGLLAATAKKHNLILATRNVKDVVLTDVRCLNPFDSH